MCFERCHLQACPGPGARNLELVFKEHRAATTVRSSRRNPNVTRDMTYFVIGRTGDELKAYHNRLDLVLANGLPSKEYQVEALFDELLSRLRVLRKSRV